jgi:hypothetical protein
MGIGDLIEKRANHRGVIDILPGHLDGDDLAAIGIDARAGGNRHSRPIEIAT